MKIIPIYPDNELNKDFAQDPIANQILSHTLSFYSKTGYNPPWCSYLFERNGIVVGTGAFKGGPKDGKVEIAYMTFEAFRKQGIGTQICELLVRLAGRQDRRDIKVTARTLPERNPSTRILDKNGFKLEGTVNDPEDGEVWEWVLPGPILQ